MAGTWGGPRMETLYARLNQSRLSLLLGPLYVLYVQLLKLLGFEANDQLDAAQYNALSGEFITLTDHAIFWKEAVARMVEAAETAKAKGKPYTVPEWFIWLSRFDVTIAPARLKTLMTAWSLTGRAAVMGISQSLSHIISLALQAPVMSGVINRHAAGLWDVFLWPD